MPPPRLVQIIVNHLVNAESELAPNAGSDRAWVWSAYDFSEGEVEEACFAIRFANSENAQKFKDAYESSQAEMKKLMEGADSGNTAEGDEAAAALDGLKVKEGEARWAVFASDPIYQRAC